MMESSLDEAGDEAVISFDDEDDDDMVELFSFGASPSNPSNKKKSITDYSNVMASVMPVASKDDNGENDNDSERSEDSFLDLLESQQPSMITAIKNLLPSSPIKSSNSINSSKFADIYEEDKDTQDILNWLDEQDNAPTSNESAVTEEEKVEPIQPPKPFPVPEPAPPPPPTFDTLEQAVKSNKSTINQIRELLDKEKFVVSAQVRPHLWCRVVCGKTLEETLQSSVADSFQHWEQQYSEQQSLESTRKEGQQGQDNAEVGNESNNEDQEEDKQLAWIKKESKVLADRIVMVTKGDPQLSQKALISILLNHYNTGSPRKPQPDQGKGANEGANTGTDHLEEPKMIDPLVPPVVCAILSAGVPKVAAAVMLNHIVPSYMPILALTIKEREIAQKRLHRQFYLLACYHLPLLVFHLDRYLPDWYLWKSLTTAGTSSSGEAESADGRKGGILPQSWLLSHLAGECQGTFMNPKWLLSLWDLILTSSNNSLRFFLVMAILEMHSDQLLLTTDQALKDEVHRIMQFKENISDDGFGIEAEEETTTKQAIEWVHEWADRARALWEATPTSVIRKLKCLEDDAVKEALTKRQEQAEERLRLKLEAQAKAHQDALEAERDEARLRLTRARLIAFYRTHNPGKEDNVEKIMKNYKGRYDVLDAKLKQKYGVGFNPALKPKPLSKDASKILSTMNVGIGTRRNNFFAGRGGAKNDRGKDERVIPYTEKKEKVAVTVQPSEILPILCWSKQGNVNRLARLAPATKQDETDESRMPLKYYLVDSRPESAAVEQGRFPTSVSLSPETLLDADRIQQHEEMFESLRGAVHICIMGEGFSALPGLYGHKMTEGLYDYIKEDESRNNLCALFFIKKGFPFVSVLDGGFAAAHAWLCRDGPKNHHLKASNVLTDYNPEVSLFGQFETLYQEQQLLANAPAREKAQRALQGLFDTSMTALARNTMVFESLASEIETGENLFRQNVVSKFFGAENEVSGGSSSPAMTKQPSLPAEETGAKLDSTADAKPLPSSAFLNRFGRKPQGSSLSRESSEGSLVVESVDFESQTDKVATTEDGNQDSSIDKNPHARTPPTNTFAVFRHQGQHSTNNASARNQAGRYATDAPSSSSAPTNRGNMRFGGLGAALNNARIHNPIKPGGAASAGSNPNKGIPRNPFARFGMDPSAQKGDGQTTANMGVGVGMARNLAGWNQLRKKTMERMRTGGTGGTGNGNSLIVEDEQPKQNAQEDDDIIEESVSLDQSSPAIASSSSAENDLQDFEAVGD